MKTRKTKKMERVLFVVMILAITLSLAACGGNSVKLNGSYVVVSGSSSHPAGQIITFEDGFATNMWIYGGRDQFAYQTYQAEDGYTAFQFESYAGIDHFTYYVRKDGNKFKVTGAIEYSNRNRAKVPTYFTFEKQ